MVRRSIAVFLLLSVAAWAEVVVSPFLTIHVAHLQAAKSASPPQTPHQHAMPVHPCCPRVNDAAPVTADPVLSNSGVPCEDKHRCCFRQGPQSPPSPVQAIQQTAPEIHIVSITVPSFLLEGEIPQNLLANVSPPPTDRSTVIRV